MSMLEDRVSRDLGNSFQSHFVHVNVEEVSCVDSFVALEGIIANFSEFISVEVCTPVVDCVVISILSVPVIGGAIDCFSCDWTV